MASSSDLPKDILNMFPEYVPKSNVWTKKHKYPRTVYNSDFIDWSHHPFFHGENLMARHPVQSYSPQTTLRMFRPLPPYEKGAVVDHQLDLRKKLAAPKGLSTPEPTFHLGHKHFSLNPTCKRLRKYDDPIPQPLDTTTRVSYVDPRSKGDYLGDQNIERYGLSDHTVALGIGRQKRNWEPERRRRDGCSLYIGHSSRTSKRYIKMLKDKQVRKQLHVHLD